MFRALLAVASVGLTIFALADCVQTEAGRIRSIPKWGWIVLIVLLPWVGPITWMVIGKDRSDGDDSPGPGPRRDGPLAPDEDPEFLRRLDADIRREKRERRRQEHEEPGTDGTAAGESSPQEPRPEDPEQERRDRDDEE